MSSAYREKKVASTPNDPFAKPLLIGGLALLAIAVVVLVSSLFTTIERNSTVGTIDTDVIQQVARENLAPIGSIVAVDKSVAPIARTGQEVYVAVCTSCHASGVLGAPKLEQAAWTERATKGLKALVTSAINGINQMPARGGDPSITDDEMQDAVLYMTKQAGLALAAETEGVKAVVTTEAAKIATTMLTKEPTIALDDTAPAAAPAGIDGQKIYKSICFSCHDSGVAGSPKIGDKEAWVPRVATGMQALYDAVINGKGIMPARGGNPALSDDELKAAVDWMIAESQ